MQKKRGRSCILGIVLLGIIGICLIVSFVFIGINEYKITPRLVSGFDFGTYNLDGYTYSNQQQAVVESWGPPPGFYILFYQREDASGKAETVRYEEWTYPQQGAQVIYENGVEISRGETDPAAMIEALYSPEQFFAFMNREQLAALTGLDEWFILPVEKELMQNAEIYYASGLMFGLQNGELIYVEAVPFEDEDAPALILPTAAPALVLTPEEVANQGTHVYDVTFLQGGEIIEEHSTRFTITFFEGGCQLGENESTAIFTKIAANQYQEDADDPLLMTFSLDGFSWTFVDSSQYETIFVFQE